MELEYLRGLLRDIMYKDRADVYRGVKIKVGLTDDFDEDWQLIYEQIPCKLSYYGKTITAHRDDRAQHLTTDLRLTCHPEIEIRPNDFVRVAHCGQVWELVAGEEFNYETHKEISVRRRKEAGQC